jgi:hypothetical protein
MLKEFSKEGQFESNFHEVTVGRICALTVHIDANGYGLGIAYANEPGYAKVPMTWCNSDSYEEMSDYADKMNKELFGLEVIQALDIVSSSMRASNIRKQRRAG